MTPAPPRAAGGAWTASIVAAPVVAVLLASAAAPGAAADSADGRWRTLFRSPPNPLWRVGGDAQLDPKDPRELVLTPGEGVLLSSHVGTKQQRNLLTNERFGDCEVRLDFMLSERSNAGVKLHGLYELQLRDSHGVAEPDATHAGGVYPRAEKTPRYRHIDKGVPPLTNAALPAGEWQTLLIRFRAARFDADGAKSKPALFEEVRINGRVVQRMTKLHHPTGANWRLPESPTGPLYLQGDHGPVAYRNVRVRPLPTPR